MSSSHAKPSAAVASQSMLQDFPLDARPTCPTVLIPFNGTLFSLPINRMDVSCEFHVSTAFVKIDASWTNVAIYKENCMFALPLNGTVTKVSMSINGRLYDTLVIPKDEAERLKGQDDEAKSSVDAGTGSTAAASNEGGTGEYEMYVPNLFRLPVPSVSPSDVIEISVVYIEDLFFSEGRYHFNMPLQFANSLIPAGKKMSDVLSISCVINAVTANTTFECTSHRMEVVDRSQFPRIELEAVVGKKPENLSGSSSSATVNLAEGDQPGLLSYCTEANSVDFNISYSMASEEIVATLLKEDPTPDEPGSFLLFVTPPSVDNAHRFFNRNMVFLLDRSGSMTGDPFIEATKALKKGLDSLEEHDRFNIIVFDHRQVSFQKRCVSATRNNITSAKNWVSGLVPNRGGTDIYAPLEQALNILDDEESSSLVLPFVVLLTDGCVANERDICQFAQGRVSNARILTFGIGYYCNWYFLQMLAQIGRGFSDVVVYKECIYSQMTQLLDMAAIPVITNVRLEIPGEAEIVDLVPRTIPDLFMGAPLTISGQFTGQFPPSITLRGQFADNDDFSLECVTRSSQVVPVSKVCIKQRLESLTADSWMTESKEIEDRVVDLSVRNSMPSAFTALVSFESDEQKRREVNALQADLFDLGDVDDDGPQSSRSSIQADEKSSLVTHSRRQSASARKEDQKKKWYRDPKKLAGLAIGHAVVIGAAAYSFGDVAGTLANVPVIDGGGDIDCGCDEWGCGECLSC